VQPCSAAKSVFDICAGKFISANRVERALALLRPWGMEEAPAQAADVARGLDGARPGVTELRIPSTGALIFEK